MNPEAKPVIIIVVITAIIITLGLSLTKNSNPAATTVTPIESILISTTTPMIYGQKVPAEQRVTIVEFGDFACPACAVLSPNINKVLSEFDGYVNYGLRIIPIHGELSKNSAIAAFAAGKQGKFFEMSTILFEKQDNWTKPGANTAELFLEYAGEAGVPNIDLYKSDVASPTFQKVIGQMIDRDSQHASQMKIASTPTLIIGGTEVVSGAGSYESLKEIVAAQIEKAKTATSSQASPVTASSAPTEAAQN